MSGVPPQKGQTPLRIHKARYGWREDIWGPSDCQVNPYYDPVLMGCKDVTEIVKRDVHNNELKLNPGKAKDWLNLHFWPERALWPPKPRKVAIKYSWGDGPIIDLETEATPHERYSVIISKPAEGDDNVNVRP